MIRFYLLTFFTLISMSMIHSQDTFYKQYEFALEDDDEDIRFIYNIDDTIRLISIRTVSTVGINFSSIDTNGEVISNIYHDDIYFFEEAILYDEEKEQFIIDGISRRDPPNKNCIFILDKYGSLIETKCNQYALPDDNALGDVDDVLKIVKTNFGYASSGAEFDENGFWYALLNIFDDDLNLTFSDTIENLRVIGNIGFVGHGFINAIGLVQNNDIFVIDSMFFLKIDQSGQIIKQVRIPHTEPTLQLNGHYPFVTDTVTGNSYLFDKYDYDSAGGNLERPRILKFDREGNIIWEFNDWQTSPRLRSQNLYLRNNGDLIAHGKAVLYDITTNRFSDVAQLVSIDSEGNFLWDKIFYDLVNVDDAIERNFLISRNITEDSGGSIYCGALGFLPIAGEGQDKPFLIKMTPEGCFTSDCRTMVNLGDYHKPNNLVTERNEIHIYNKDNGKSYRYTFYRKNDIERGGELLKSNTMSGNDDWESTGRDFIGIGIHGQLIGKYVKEDYNFAIEIPDAFSDWQYRFSYELGDELRLEHPYTNVKEYLRVIDVQDITLLDGRTKRKLILECQNPDPDGDPYPLRTWIEDIGDIDDFLNTPYACSNPGNEVVTCFFSDGELIWKHPDYDFCTVATEDVIENINGVFPNPTHDILKLNFSLDDYFIMDIYGQVHLSGKSMKKGKTIDVSNLISGSYMLGGSDEGGNNVILKFVKI